MSAPRLAVSCVVLALAGSFSVSSYAAGQAQDGKGAKVYTWVDKNGHRHYSDQPAAPQTARRIDVRVSQSRQVTDQGDKDKASSASAPEDETKNWEQGATPDEKIAPTRDAACTVAQKNLKVLEDGSRTAYKRDAAGNPVALEGDARAAEVARAQKDVDAYCKK